MSGGANTFEGPIPGNVEGPFFHGDDRFAVIIQLEATESGNIRTRSG